VADLDAKSGFLASEAISMVSLDSDATTFHVDLAVDVLPLRGR